MGEEKQGQGPNFTEKIQNFLGDSWLFVLSGFEVTTESEQNERLQNCKNCEFSKKNSEGDPYLCEKCGCNLHLKAIIKSSRCPLDKW